MAKAVVMFHKDSIKLFTIIKVPLFRLNQSSTKSNVNNRLTDKCRTYTTNLVFSLIHGININNSLRDVKCLISHL